MNIIFVGSQKLAIVTTLQLYTYGLRYGFNLKLR